ncbi:MAG: hypothetical protein PHD48_05040 [Alphaproteobacteria bacterium]|nr:hypothetical protein [Alphaproteobacteria bacterium]
MILSSPALSPALGPMVLSTASFSGFNVCVLDDPQWLDGMMAVHQKTREALPADQKHFLLPKTPEYFASLLKGEGGAIIGAFSKANDEVVGFCAVVGADHWRDAQAKGFVSCPDSDQRLADACGQTQIDVVQSFCVNPSFQGSDLSRGLLGQALSWCQYKRQPVSLPFLCKEGVLLAQVAGENACALTKFMKAGYAMEATWTQDVDGIKRQKVLMRYMPRKERMSMFERNPQGIKLSTQTAPLLADVLVRYVAAGRRVFLMQGSGRKSAPVFAYVPI